MTMATTILTTSATIHDDLVDERMIYYLRKNYYKTASLIDNLCKLAVVSGLYDYRTSRAA